MKNAKTQLKILRINVECLTYSIRQTPYGFFKGLIFF